METLQAGTWPVLELQLSDELSLDDRQLVTGLAGDRGVPVSEASCARLTQLCGSRDHQGLLARMPPFPYRPLDDVLAGTGPCPALGLLDGIQDPHNFGAIIRAAEVQGVDGLIVGTERQSPVTAAVARSSAGAVNHLPIAQVPDLGECIHKLTTHGIAVMAADAGATTILSECDLTRPTVIVLGNESTGVRPELLELCDMTVRIPQAGHVESLNVAVAAGILFYELQRQRRLAV